MRNTPRRMLPALKLAQPEQEQPPPPPQEQLYWPIAKLTQVHARLQPWSEPA